MEAGYDAENSDMYRRLDSLLELNRGNKLDTNLVNQICEIVSYEANPMVDTKLQSDLRALLTGDKSVFGTAGRRKNVENFRKKSF